MDNIGTCLVGCKRTDQTLIQAPQVRELNIDIFDDTNNDINNLLILKPVILKNNTQRPHQKGYKTSKSANINNKGEHINIRKEEERPTKIERED